MSKNTFGDWKQPFRRKPLVIAAVELDEDKAGAAATPPSSWTAQITNPSDRLSLSIDYYFEKADRTLIAAADISGATWTLALMREDRETRRLARLQTIFTAQACPQSYVVNDAGLYEVDLAVALTAGNDKGVYYIGLTWEPNTPMCDDELDTLFKLCVAKAQGTAIVDHNGVS